MEIIIWIIAIWFIWSIFKHMSKGKQILKILNEVRIEALKNPSLYSVSSDLNSISEEEAEERIAGLLILALKADGYDLSDYTRNIEISITFNQTVRDVYNALKKESIANDARRIVKELAQEKSKRESTFYKQPARIPEIDIDEDEIPF